MAPTASKYKLTDVSEPILVKIMSNFKTLDAIVSKERISIQFGAAVDAILKKRRQINNDIVQNRKVLRNGSWIRVFGCREVNEETFMRLIARMPKLRRLSFNCNYHSEVAERVARINPNLAKICLRNQEYPISMICDETDFIKYVNYVKQNNRNYDGSNFEHVFNYNQHFREYSDLNPELNVRLLVQGYYVNQCPYKQLINRVLLNRVDILNETLPSVKRLISYQKSVSKIIENLKCLPNITELELHDIANDSHSIVDASIIRYISQSLTSIDLKLELDPKYDEQFVHFMDTLIRSRPIKKVSITDTARSYNRITMLVNIISNYDGHRITDLCLTYQKSSQNNYWNSMCICVHKNVLQYKVASNQDVNLNHLAPLLASFNKVNIINILMANQPPNLDEVIQSCHQIADENRHRVVRLVIGDEDNTKFYNQELSGSYLF